MKNDKLQKTLLKLGSEPQLSLRRFFIGLALFAVSICLIYFGVTHSHWFQIIGLGLMGFAFVLALYGYLGILSNRLAAFRHHSYKNRQKYRHIK